MAVLNRLDSFVFGPIGVVLDYAGTTAPNGWLLCYGQAISRTTYASLFAAISTTFGVGDGSTTFNLPDLRGRVIAGKDDMGGSGANRITSSGQASITGSTLGAAGGAQDNTLDTTRIPAHTHSVTDPGHIHSNTLNYEGEGTAGNVAGFEDHSGLVIGPVNWNTASNTTNISIQNAGGGGAHNNMQPTFILNKIICAGK